MESRSPKDYLLKPEEHFVFWLIALAALLAMQIGSGWLPGPDESSYLSIARSLGTGHGFTRFSGERYLHYAPGYPLLIAPAFALQAARPFVAIGFIQWILAVLFMLGLYLWSRRYFGSHAVLLTALVVTNVGFWYYYRRTGPEIGFMAGMIWAVNLLTPATERRIGQAIGLTLAGSALVAFICWIRPVGVFIASGFGVTLFMLACRRHISWGRCFLLGGIASVIALASVIGFISSQSVGAAERRPGAVTYTGELLDKNRPLPALVVEGVRLRVTEIGRLLIPGMFKSYDAKGRWIPNTLFIFVPVFILFAVGWRRFAMRAPNVLAWAFPFYLGLYILWWGEQGTRYMMPMLPVLWASMWHFAAPWERFRRPVFAALVAAQLIVAGIYWTGDLQQMRQLAGYWPKLDRMAAAVQSEPANGAICADRHIGCMFLVALDRDWPIVQKASAVDPGVRWLLISDDRGDTPGFTTKARAGDLRLMERD